MTYLIDSLHGGKMPQADISGDCRNVDDYRDCIRHALRTGGIVPSPRTDREREALTAAFPQVAQALGVNHG